MIRIALLTLFSVTALLPAQDAAPAKAEPVPRYQLKNRSNFLLEKETRSPFWPIGWQKSSPVRYVTQANKAAPAVIQLQPQYFQVTSIIDGNPALATINGRSFAVGEILPVVFGTERLRVVVRAIRDGGVWLEHQGQQCFVPMRRIEATGLKTIENAPSQEFTIRIDGQK